MCNNIINSFNLPVDIHTTMITSSVKTVRKIDTQIGGIYIHPRVYSSDFNFEEFINDFTSTVFKIIKTPLRIHVEYDEYYGNIEVIVHTSNTLCIEENVIKKIFKCLDVLIKFRGKKYEKPPTYYVTENYTPVA